MRPILCVFAFAAALLGQSVVFPSTHATIPDGSTLGKR